MKSSSAKAKGRALQDWVRDKLRSLFNWSEDDVRCAIMGEGGADVKLTSVDSRTTFPYSIECKNTERFTTLYNMYEQARSHDKGLEPLLIVKMNRKPPLAIISAEYFIRKNKNG